MESRKPRITAVLGPTNTGKTHYAMERMLGHRSGMIGFPLRLLARENYDRAVAQKGPGKVALITGEEKIIPAGAQYFLCTVEAMPIDRAVEFLGIDEIQVCADSERGHIFTDRLLHARGLSETMFMGAETIAPLIRLLVPGVEFVSRPRFSTLTYAGERKLTRLPPQSVVVAFSASDVYAIAEQVRRHRGGAAVVMGALSPRTRNAQVALYQAGEVDYLIATDAIGMGLNMDVNHVAFAATAKFDGHRQRALYAPELAQIAGRAGRHMNDGTFGITNGAAPILPEYIDRIENHNFRTLKLIYWRNADLDLGSLEGLQRSLALPPDREGLVRAGSGDDELALALLARDDDIARLAHHPDAVSLLWDVCQVPDFRGVMNDAHADHLGRIYTLLMATGGTGDTAGKLPTDWVAGQVQRVDRSDGDIEALTGHLANIRTWTYIANRSSDADASWLHDPVQWQEKTRAIEDRLSDALHERLTQRFVDKRTSVLVKHLKSPGEMLAVVDGQNQLSVEGHVIGELSGFRFVPEKMDSENDTVAAGKSIAAAARRVLGAETLRRIGWLEAAPDSTITLADDATLEWRGAMIGRLVRGADILAPDLESVHDEHLPNTSRERLNKRLNGWWAKHLSDNLGRLADLHQADVAGPSKGIAFQVCEGLGMVPRKNVIEQINALAGDDRKDLKKLGVVIGRESVFIQALLKPAAVRMRGLLWSLWTGAEATLQSPPPGRVSLPLDNLSTEFLGALGYRTVGRLAIRADMLERLAARAWSAARKGPFAIDADLLSLAGCGVEDMTEILKDLGFAPAPQDKTAENEVVLFQPSWKAKKRPGKAKPRPAARQKPAPRRAALYDPDSPFAKLKEMAIRK